MLSPAPLPHEHTEAHRAGVLIRTTTRSAWIQALCSALHLAASLRGNCSVPINKHY